MALIGYMEKGKGMALSKSGMAWVKNHWKDLFLLFPFASCPIGLAVSTAKQVVI